MAVPIGRPAGLGKTLKQWLRDNYPDVADQLDASPAHRYARQRDYKDGEFAKKHPSRSGRVP
jgi:hypothetical protein